MPVGEQRLAAVAGSREKYRAIARIGRGGMAEVLLAVLPGPAKVRKLLVLKRPLSFLTQDEHFNTMFLTEARIASRLNHPNVISTFEVGQSSEGPFIVMEYLEGQPLSNVFRRLGTLRMPLSYRLHVLRNLLAGLDYVHTLTDFDGRGLRLVHCDVSPQNVFIGYDGRVTLVDFGIAKAERIGRVARPGVIEGKIGYMAPEQLAGRAVDQRADIFSFGVILWETLAGLRITLGEDDADVIRNRTRGEIPELREYAPETPPALVELCARTLARNPADRIQTAAAVMEALDGFVDQSGVRINDREVGQYIGNAFSVEREARRRLIESQMVLVDRGAADLTALPDLLRPDAPATGSGDIASGGDVWESESVASAASDPTRVTVSLMPEEVTQANAAPPRPAAPPLASLDSMMPQAPAFTEVLVRTNNRPAILTFAALLAVAAIVFFAIVRKSPSTEVGRVVPPAPVVATPPPAAAPPTVRPSAPAEPEAAIVAPIVTARPAEERRQERGSERGQERGSERGQERGSEPLARRRPTAARPVKLADRPLPPSPASMPVPAAGVTAPAPSEPRVSPRPPGATRAGPAPGDSLGHPAPRSRRALDLDNPYGP